jgi:integrase
VPSIKTTLPLRFTKIGTLAPGYHRDGHVSKLLVRVPPNGGKRSFYFYSEVMVRGERLTQHKLIGHWPETTPEKARRLAKMEDGRIAAGRIEPGKRRAVKFKDAFERYKEHLKAKATKRDKPARWHTNVHQYGRLHLLPKWGGVSLADMSRDPKALADWHVKLTKNAGPITADRCCQVIRATYKFEAKLNRSLPVHLPTSGVTFNGDQPRETGIDDWRAWAKAWKAIPSPVRRAYVLCALLLGGRPTETSLLKWSDVKVRERVIVIGKSKSGIDIRVPMSWPIAACLRMAHGADDVKVFPGARHNPLRDGLPAYGNSLRHAWRGVAADLEIDDLISSCLMGHAPKGVHASYVPRLALSLWPGMRGAQRRISRRILDLLRLDASPSYS